MGKPECVIVRFGAPPLDLHERDDQVDQHHPDEADQPEWEFHALSPPYRSNTGLSRSGMFSPLAPFVTSETATVTTIAATIAMK